MYVLLGSVPAGTDMTLDALNFFILAFIIMVKEINRLKRHHAEQAAAAPAVPPEDLVLLREIRDSLPPPVDRSLRVAFLPLRSGSCGPAKPSNRFTP